MNARVLVRKLSRFVLFATLLFGVLLGYPVQVQAAQSTTIVETIGEAISSTVDSLVADSDIPALEEDDEESAKLAAKEEKKAAKAEKKAAKAEAKRLKKLEEAEEEAAEDEAKAAKKAAKKAMKAEKKAAKEAAKLAASAAVSDE